MSTLDNGMMKCALVITDDVRSQNNQNSYSLCDQEKRHTRDSGGDSVSSLESLEVIVSNRRA